MQTRHLTRYFEDTFIPRTKLLYPCFSRRGLGMYESKFLPKLCEVIQKGQKVFFWDILVIDLFVNDPFPRSTGILYYPRYLSVQISLSISKRKKQAKWSASTFLKQLELLCLKMKPLASLCNGLLVSCYLGSCRLANDN